ncbi:6016_t:CDS:2, partial [Cetraspora pellucida]
MSKFQKHPVASFFNKQTCKICDHKVKYNSGITSMKKYFINKHKDEWNTIHKYEFTGGKTPNYKTSTTLIEASLIKKVIESARELVTDVNIEFTESGIRFTNMNSAH